MAHNKTNVSGLDFVQRGYGQVELNHMSYWFTGQMYAQLPAAADIEVLQQGQFAKYDYANKEVNFTGAGEWMMVFNEEKLYEDRETLSDYAMKREDFGFYDWNGYFDANHVYSANGTMMPEGTQMVPRLVKTNVGDIFTTNTINIAEEDIETDLVAGAQLTVGEDGFLAIAATEEPAPGGVTGESGAESGATEPAAAPAGPVFEVAKVTTMPDGQRAVKVMRIA